MPICQSRVSVELCQRGCCGGNKLEFEMQLSSSVALLYTIAIPELLNDTGRTDSAKWQMYTY
jgi:hypothetical protein